MDTSHGAMDLDADPRLARKRVPRACDQCRRRKSRCDGHANCSACRSVGLSCSYGQVAKQVRGPSYVAHLERTVEELQHEAWRLTATQSSSIRRRSPGSISPTSPDFFPAEERIPNVPSLSYSNSPSSKSRTAEPANAYVEIIAREPRAKPFGIDILRQLCNFCYSLPRPGGSHRQDSAMKIIHALDAPFPLDHYSNGGTSSPPLPPDEVLFVWLELAFSEALPLWHFVDKKYLESILHRMWSTTDFGHDENDKDDLALLYAVLALGQRIEVGENGPAERRMQGLSFFAVARDAVPLASCERSIPAIQTVLCMALYLTAASSITRFHAYVSAAASAALRMGLHEQISGYPEEEQALRRRVWLAVQTMDVYASTALGLPGSPSSVAIQTEVIGSTFPGIDESILVTAAQHQLAGVLHRCIDRTYRYRDVQATSSVQPLVVSTRALRESSEELESWSHNCAFIADQLSNGTEGSLPQLAGCTRTQLLLHYAHCNAQLLLYTPLVHHLASPTTERLSDAYLYGTRCMRAALATVSIAEELQRRFQLNEAYFNTVDSLLNAILVLLTVQLGSSDGDLLREAIPAARRAKEVLLNLAPLSVKVAECWEALAPLFQTGKPRSSKDFSSTRKANVADIRDSFRTSYKSHYASSGAVDPSSIDPMQMWTNEPMIAGDVEIPR